MIKRRCQSGGHATIGILSHKVRAVVVLLFYRGEGEASPLYDDVGWFDLPDDAREALKVLGYNGYKWDQCSLDVWSTTAWWKDMSEEARQAAELLGWDANSWDTSHPDDHYCNDMGVARGTGPPININNNNNNNNNSPPTAAPEQEPEQEPEPESTPNPTEEPTPRPTKNDKKNDKNNSDDEEDDEDDDNIGDNDADNNQNDDADDDTDDASVPPIVRNQIRQASPDSMPHMAGRWRDGFPNGDATPTALCNNNIALQDNGDLCVEGRATFQQLLDFLGGDAILYATSSSTVSVNGLIMSGEGDLGLAGDWRYIYDFVNSYTVNGQSFSFTTSQALMDHTFLASRGTIDGFCLDASFRQGPPAYRISIEPSLPFFLQADAGSVQDATIVYISAYVLTIEYHTAESDVSLAQQQPIPVETEVLFNDLLEEFFFGEDGSGNPNPNDPGFIDNLTGAAAFFGLLRYFRNQGIFVTRSLLNGIYESDDNWFENEQIQMDTQWSVFVDMVDSGWFDENPPPTFELIVAVRHIRANGNSRGCWKEDTAAIAIGSPPRAVNDNENYAAQVLDGIEQFGGKITLHYGKRSPTNAAIRRAALRTYEECGIEMDINPVRCVHPSCRRTEVIESFEWPPEYYDV